MKNKVALIIVLLFILVGCNKESSREEILLKKYETAYSELVSNNKFEEKSEFFKLEVVTQKLSVGGYRVDVIMDEPQVAMYNIQLLMELDSKGIEQFETINPSLGIVDDTEYNMIPNQVNEINSFYEGLILSSISEHEEGSLKMMITWTNYANTKRFVEFIELPYSTNDRKAARALEIEEDLEEVDSSDE